MSQDVYWMQNCPYIFVYAQNYLHPWKKSVFLHPWISNCVFHSEGKMLLKVIQAVRIDFFGITSFLNFYTKHAESSFLCNFRIESVNVFVLPRFVLCHVLSSSTTISHMQKKCFPPSMNFKLCLPFRRENAT
jgi:hypothetical protein